MWKFSEKCGKNRKFPEKCGNFRQNLEKKWKNKGKNWKFPEKSGNLLKRRYFFINLTFCEFIRF